MAKSKNVDEEVVKTEVVATKDNKQQKKTDKKKDKKPAKEKKTGLFKKLRESWSELKKVSWPTFSSVVKKTGIVILVVLLFTVVLFGIDYGLGWVYKLFLN